MAITATTTAAEALAQYLGNLGYASANDTAKAALFIEAAEALLILRPSRSKSGDKEVEYPAANELRAALARAQAWLDRATASSGFTPTVFSMRGARD